MDDAAGAVPAIAWEIEGSTFKFCLDVPLEKHQGLPSNVTFLIAKLMAMIGTWGTNKRESLVCNQSVRLDEMD